MKVHFTPRSGEAQSRAAERVVGEVLEAAGYTVEGRSPRAHGGDLFVWDLHGVLTIVEVRSCTIVDADSTIFFDVDKGLRAHRRLAEKMGASRIVVVAVFIDEGAEDATLGALGAEHVEALARRRAEHYVGLLGSKGQKRSRPVKVLWAEDMAELDEVFDLEPGNGAVA
ncbi:hypothetical protein [Nesterenkonia aerolata]|uniref:Uncharacterized protein n=1 Tax=Nesterenkonia aerolata TaxID=3074079 RepID=A0ABU2DT23_9MICC|nr:hypothetical protein [Nesterenkonia sp. LY-0111]MDR8019647.1 hypothetical protein [Nesterenkonia sp. LY-0111]